MSRPTRGAVRDLEPTSHLERPALPRKLFPKLNRSGFSEEETDD